MSGPMCDTVSRHVAQDGRNSILRRGLQDLALQVLESQFVSTRLAEFLLLFNTTAYEGLVDSWLPTLTWKLTSCVLGQVSSLDFLVCKVTMTVPT